MPAGWDLRQLKHSVHVNREVLSEETDADYLIDYIDISSVDSAGNILDIQEIPFGRAPSRARRRVHGGDTIMSTVRTYLKAIAFIEDCPENLIVSTGFAVLSPGRLLCAKFVWYLVQSAQFVDAVVAHSQGVGYPAINPSRLGTLPVWIPSEPEQAAIADFLDRETAKIDALIATKERLIDLLQEKRTALIGQAVTKGLHPNVPMKDSGIQWLGEIPAHWDTSPLKRLTTCLDGRRIPLNSLERSARRGGYPYWGANGVVDHIDGWLFDEELVLLGEDGAPFFDRLKDVAFAVSGKIWVNNHIHVLRPAAGVDSFFLAQCLNLADYAPFVEGSTRDKLTQARMDIIPVPHPAKGEQRAIASYLRWKTGELDAIAGKVRKAISKLREYRTALICAAVTGKIDVREAGP
jgi:restriction endonuclease S subunit